MQGIWNNVNVDEILENCVNRSKYDISDGGDEVPKYLKR